MLLTYYCNTQKQSYGELAKFVGKQLCRSLFFSKVADRLKKRFRHFFKEHFRKAALDIKFFFELVLYRYSRNNWKIFQVIGFFLQLMSGFQTLKPRHVAKSSKTGQNSNFIDKVFMQAWTLRKLKTFLSLFL